jgi:S1-C subfamily serine protease
VVTEFNGQQVTSSGGLTTLLWQTVPGRAVPLAYLAQGRLHHTVVTVTEQPTSS